LANPGRLPLSIIEVSVRRTSLRRLTNMPHSPPDQILQIAGPLVVGAEQYGRNHFQVRIKTRLVRTCSAHIASPPLPKRNAANVLLERIAFTVMRCRNLISSGGYGTKGGQEEL